MDHTTAAHELLSWPTIKHLLGNKMLAKDYVSKGEWSRGLLRLYGHGEGQSKDDTVRGAASPSGSVISSNSEEASHHNATSPDFAWGFDFERDGVPVAEDHPGVLAHDGRLKLDEENINEYVKSYMQHMYTMHPILDPRKLSTMLQRFKQSYTPSKPGAALGKRKREGDFKPPYQGDHNAHQGGDAQGQKFPKVARTISNAIVVLVLALGKICTHQRPLPGPVRAPRGGPTSTPSSQPSTLRSTSVVSSMHNSPSFQHAVPSEGYVSSPSDPGQSVKNMDVIPGLAYFAWAVGILGEHLGGSDLEHCQAFLLAALYWGQLAHPYSSYAWIVQASSACIGLIHRSAEMMAKMHQETPPLKPVATKLKIQVDLIETCYWTCLQLESDIRAELKELQPSGIATYEAWMDRHNFHPSATAIDSRNLDYTDEEISEYYFFQLYLRKQLNQIQSEFYDPKNKHKIKIPLIEGWAAALNEFRRFIGNKEWSDEDDAANNILAARLRAKFYGGRNIIIRPLLENIIEEELKTVEQYSENQTLSSPVPPGLQSGTHSPTVAHLRPHHGKEKKQLSSGFKLAKYHALTQSLHDVELPPLDPRQHHLAEIGIKSLISSTVAFDKVATQRLIVTNVFGTLHAQFGNMLVLAAAYQSPRLKGFVKYEQLQFLFERTIRVLKDHEDVSPTLREDAVILSTIQQNLPKRGSETSDSFSSQPT